MTQAFDHPDLRIVGLRVEWLDSGFAVSTEKDHENRPADDRSGYFGQIRLSFLLVLLHIEEHDHEQEKYHDSPGVNDNVHCREELGIQQDIMPREREERQDQVQNAVNGVTRYHDHHRAQDGQEG